MPSSTFVREPSRFGQSLREKRRLQIGGKAGREIVRFGEGPHQYSSASMMVRTPAVRFGSVRSLFPPVNVGS